MLSFDLTNVRRLLCVGAHADDIEIGLGGTLLSLLQRTPDLKITWAVASAPGPRADEARASAQAYLREHAASSIQIAGFRESFFPDQWTDIKQWFEELRRQGDPDVVFTHFRNDRHQDHRVLSDLAWNTFRNHLILEYEILKYDGDLGTPNLYVPLDPAIAERKIDLLMRHFISQTSKHWFTPDTFSALHRIRGVECASPSGMAEAFYARKAVWQPTP
ncbi:PIG-L family deacetylase [bacterium]|nr:PIG-L family deacetylase [bacterium]